LVSGYRWFVVLQTKNVTEVAHALALAPSYGAFNHSSPNARRAELKRKQKEEHELNGAYGVLETY